MIVSIFLNILVYKKICAVFLVSFVLNGYIELRSVWICVVTCTNGKNKSMLNWIDSFDIFLLNLYWLANNTQTENWNVSEMYSATRNIHWVWYVRNLLPKQHLKIFFVASYILMRKMDNIDMVVLLIFFFIVTYYQKNIICEIITDACQTIKRSIFEVCKWDIFVTRFSTV